ncbi:DsbA family protein [Rubellimicrobium arenae]|uniref:DsbA family protein n=1 Tax=Rubellimicrobium arenae TaxID=2817372 RepID=UPI001B309DD5|nr:hypothetical protein [Rubellimicrobium arenae]
MTELIYGFDPLCGWCFGIVPAMRQVRADHPDIPIRLVMAGLFAEEGVRPYAQLSDFIRGAAPQLRQVTGREPSDAFFRLIARPGVMADSGPPCIAIAHVAGLAPDRALDFAHRVIEVHALEGRDLNKAETYAPLLAEVGLGPELPDIHDAELAEAVWAQGRRIGLRSFPTLAVLKDGAARVLPSEYDPERLSALVSKAVN